MKVIFNILITVGLALCEVPPPYPSRGFRPSPPFILPSQFNSNQVRQPQRTYGVPNTTPPKLTLPSAPQTTYGVPNNGPNLVPSLSSKQTIPGTSYGVPIRDSGGSPGNNRIVNRPLQNQPQMEYGVPNPNTRNIETLEQVRQLNLLLQSIQNSQLNQGNQFALPQNPNRDVIPSTQFLPQREPSDFRAGYEPSRNTDFSSLQSQNSNRNSDKPSVQYLPSREIAHFQLSESNNQNVQNSDQNIQQLSRPQQFLPVKEATNFRQGFQLPEPGIPQVTINPNSNIDLPNRHENKAVSQSQDLNNPIPSNQYVPSDRPIRPNSFGINNQQTSNFDQRQTNDVLSSPNTNSNFGQNNPQNNFDLQPADVRKLEPANRDRNNRFETPVQNLDSTQRPITEQNRGFGGTKFQTTSGTPDQTYLVPTTTLRSVNKQLHRPNLASTTTETPFKDNNESTEPEEAAVSPNIAVSGSPGGQGFYLLQPDGRLQRVIYQKLQDVGDRENEYTANYLFQNIQHDPNVVYSPLITLGK